MVAVQLHSMSYLQRIECMKKVALLPENDCAVNRPNEQVALSLRCSFVLKSAVEVSA